MFGSKLRSWMENHIVRPRKRGNKNKQNNSDAAKKDSQIQQSNGISTSVSVAATVNVPNGNTITSPVRRREVSPIQNHSRYGWQSPDSETITSPKSDNFLYAPQQRVRNHNRFERKKECGATSGQTSSTNDSYIYQHSQSHQQQEHYSQQQLQHNSSSSFSSLSWSTGSKEPSSKVVESQTFVNERVRNLQTPIITFHGPNDQSLQDNENDDTVHYEEIQTILRHPGNTNFLTERPKSEQLTSFTPTYRQPEMSHGSYAKDDTSSVRYGKLLPSRIQSKANTNTYHSESYQLRQQFVSGSAECLPSNAENNGAWYGNGNNRGNRNPAYNPHYSTQKSNGGNSVVNGNGNGATGGAVPFHALSSPESAYSTGYSTDGTSPGAYHNHPPEYYINIRTGTHYFPKSVNSLAIEAQRYKFGLNKIEEMSPIDPMPNVSFGSSSNFYVSPKHNFPPNQGNDYQEKRQIGSHSPLVSRNAIILPTLHGFESSSPRQRCRIRTNPWYSTGDANNPNFLSTSATKQTVSTSATSSTLSSSKSSTSTFGQSNTITTTPKGRGNSNHGCEMFKRNDNEMYDDSYSSDGMEDGKHSTLSLTEVEARQRVNSLRTKRISTNKGEMSNAGKTSYAVATTTTATVAATTTAPVVVSICSDEDATLNEMMGKFDESYVYEKETDILSDSDATNCPSELDTGLDAEDECETDELLEIDFIDTSSVKELNEKNVVKLGYISRENSTRMSRKYRHQRDSNTSNDFNNEKSFNKRSGSTSSHRRRKRLIKTRKKHVSECKENLPVCSPLKRSRETRSVGGTPMSVRRNPTIPKDRNPKILPMQTRASSLIFPHDNLLKADMEADVKYHQLIEEAESILVSLKSSTQTLPRETPVSSPRRVNPLMNKRVEMLKSFEARPQPQSSSPPPHQQQSLQPRHAEMEPDLNALLNKRIELLKFESSVSVPNSPKSAPRFSPSKTHITNFINQIDGQRKSTLQSSEHQQRINNSRNSLATDCRTSRSPTPTSPFKVRAQQKQQTSVDFESDLEIESNGTTTNFVINYSKSEHKMDVTNHNCLPEITRVLLRGDALDDYTNHNENYCSAAGNNNYLAIPKSCPQSEPLKRKVYKGSNTFERIKFSLDLESEKSKTNFLHKVQSSRYENDIPGHMSTFKGPLAKASSQELNYNLPNLMNKKQLLLDTLSELKQNLQNQSFELNGLNAN